MKTLYFLALAGILGLLIPAAVTAEDAAEHIVITVPFAKIYSALDPDSSIIRMAAQNEHFVLDHAGQKWFRIRLEDGRVGFITTRDAKLASSGGGLSGLFIVVAIVIVAASAFFGLRARKHRASAEV